MSVKQKYKSSNYLKLIQAILSSNRFNTVNQVVDLQSSNWSRILREVREDDEPEPRMPRRKDIFPDPDLDAERTKARAKRMMQGMRQQMMQDLQTSMVKFKLTGKQPYIRQRGPRPGTINPELIADFENRLRRSFEGFTKTDPRYKMPSNIHTIAVTEARRTINDAKMEYAREIIKKNPHIRIRKRWVHNPHLSKEPRVNHAKMHLKEVPFDGLFKVPSTDGGFDLMDRPHDINAPVGQVANCNCDLVFVTKKKYLTPGVRSMI